jgi:zinc protease
VIRPLLRLARSGPGPAGSAAVLAAALLLGGCSLPWSRAAAPAGPRTPRQVADSLLRRPGPPVGLDVVRSLEFPPLRFRPPEPTRFELSNGVSVFFLRDPSLPLIDLFITVKGGHLYLDRDHYAAASALLPLMKDGGTTRLPRDSVDQLVAFHALGLRTSTNGARMQLGISGLRHQLDLVVDLWSDLLLHPRFDPDAVERWRLRELEAVRRMPDLAGSLAVVEFNRILFRDHPTGWRMGEDDLEPGRLDPDRLRHLHQRLVCPENAVIGAAGDVRIEVLRAALEGALAEWRPCGAELEPPDPPELRPDPSVYVIHRPIAQSTIVVGQPGRVLMEESDDYFASRIANWVLGGSGLTSRVMGRLRTEEGLAYSASTVWGAARRHERILGGITHTRSEATVEAARALLDTFSRAVHQPPDRDEVRLARDAIANGFVFGFTTPGQVVARQVSYLAAGLPDDWLSRYLAGISAVDSAAVADVLRQTIRPDDFTVLIVGDTTRFDASALGPVHTLPARP